ncbi:hypothetical protein BCAR13_820007 [Paraburkholderia caribensis]|nr:hypothetical protein BCAR13_820007 [Paraburkholderia caribensis]
MFIHDDSPSWIGEIIVGTNLIGLLTYVNYIARPGVPALARACFAPLYISYADETQQGCRAALR